MLRFREIKDICLYRTLRDIAVSIPADEDKSIVFLCLLDRASSW